MLWIFKLRPHKFQECLSSKVLMRLRMATWKILFRRMQAPSRSLTLDNIMMRFQFLKIGKLLINFYTRRTFYPITKRPCLRRSQTIRQILSLMSQLCPILKLNRLQSSNIMKPSNPKTTTISRRRLIALIMCNLRIPKISWLTFISLTRIRLLFWKMNRVTILSCKTKVMKSRSFNNNKMFLSKISRQPNKTIWNLKHLLRRNKS